MLIEDKTKLLEIVKHKTSLYKHIIDSNKPTLEIPEIFSVVNIKKSNAMLKEIQEHFIKTEEYEYADKIKNILEEK